MCGKTPRVAAAIARLERREAQLRLVGKGYSWPVISCGRPAFDRYTGETYSWELYRSFIGPAALVSFRQPGCGAF